MLPTQAPQPGQAPQQAQPQNGSPYPADQKEVEQAKTNAIKLIYSEGVQPLLVEVLQGDPNGMADGLAGIVAKILQSLVSSVVEKTQRKPKLSMVVNLAKYILTEIAFMAEKMKVKIPPQVLQQAGVKAGDIIEQTFGGGAPQQGQPQAPQGQPPGLLSMAGKPQGM